MDIKQQKKSARHAFNAALAAREAESKGICAKIRASRDLERYNAWDEKRAFGSETRWLLLASGFVRGLPYKVIEAKTGEKNEAYGYAIVEAAKTHANILLDGDSVVEWLAGEKPETIFAAPPEPVVAKAAPVVPAPVESKPVEKPGFFARLLGRTA